MELLDTRIRSHEDYYKIRFKSERDEAEFLQEINPEIELYYERQEYEITETQKNSVNLSKRITLPDFEAEEPTSGQRVIIEVTESKHQKTKNRHRRIMEIAEPNVPYIVFCREELQAIRNRHAGGAVIFDRTENLREIQRLLVPTFLAAD
jgi:hypothetical protein